MLQAELSELSKQDKRNDKKQTIFAILGNELRFIQIPAVGDWGDLFPAKWSQNYNGEKTSGSYRSKPCEQVPVLV